MLAYRFIWAFLMVAVIVPAGLHASATTGYMSLSENASHINLPFFFSELHWLPRVVTNALWYVDTTWVTLISIVSQVFPQSATVAEFRGEWIFLFWLILFAGLVQPPFYSSEKAWADDKKKAVHDMTVDDYFK